MALPKTKETKMNVMRKKYIDSFKKKYNLS